MILQVWLTRGGTYHEEQFPPLKNRQKPETREERKQRKYRYLYQVFTLNSQFSQGFNNNFVVYRYELAMEMSFLNQLLTNMSLKLMNLKLRRILNTTFPVQFSN